MVSLETMAGHMRRALKAALASAAFLAAYGLAATVHAENSENPMPQHKPRYALVIHGGAGTFEAQQYNNATGEAFRAALRDALLAGEKVLKDGGAAVDAVTTVITRLEDNPLFNAGKGAVFTNEAKVELDASIMRGEDLNAGAVAGLRETKNPILAARLVMEKSPHVMLHGRGADQYARENGLDMVPNEYFYTQHRLKQLKDKQAAGGPSNLGKFGTVGAAALDMRGNLAAGTSTGGLTNKRFGRIGDSPIIGAGTYASNASCAVSATGHGEYFIRATVARDICALMEYKGLSLQDAADQVVMKQLVDMGGEGGVIAVDHDGNTALIFNTSGMFRGSVVEGGDPFVGIMAGEETAQ